MFGRNSCTLNSGAYGYVNAIISGARSSSGGTSDSGSTGTGGTSLSAWSAQTLFTDNTYADGKHDIIISCTADAAPQPVPERSSDYSRNVNVNADSRASAGIAYYSADDIAAKFSQYGVSRRDMGRLILMASDYTEIYGVYVFAA